MNNQQDELLVRVDQLLVEVVSPVIQAVVDDSGTTGLAAEGTRKVAAFINSEVQAALDKVGKMAMPYDEGSIGYGDLINVIEEVRKDYE